MSRRWDTTVIPQAGRAYLLQTVYLFTCRPVMAFYISGMDLLRVWFDTRVVGESIQKLATVGQHYVNWLLGVPWM